MPEDRHTGDSAAPSNVRRADRARRARVVAAVAVVAIVLAVALDNTKSTRIGYVFGGVRAPLIVILLIALVLGAAIEWLLLRRPQRHGRQHGSL